MSITATDDFYTQGNGYPDDESGDDTSSRGTDDYASYQQSQPGLPDFPSAPPEQRPPDPQQTSAPSDAPFSLYDMQMAAMNGSSPPAPGPNSSIYDLQQAGLAAAPGTPAGQTGRRQTVEELAFQNANPNGGSFTHQGNGNMTVEQQAFQSAHPNGGSFSISDYRTPSLPDFGSSGNGAAPSGNGAASSGSGALTPDQWHQMFEKQNGFYNDTYNSRDNMLYEAQRGDLNVRKQLEQIAPYDSDARRVLDGIRANPGFDSGPASADWRMQHNREVTGREQQLMGAGGFGAPGDNGPAPGMNAPLHGTPQGARSSGNPNQAAIANLEAQRVGEINPGSIQDTMPVAAHLMDRLMSDGAQGVKFDPHTNTVSWQGTDGINRTLGGRTSAGMAEWQNTANALGMMAQPPVQQPPQQSAPSYSSGGGYRAPSYSSARSSYSAPRSSASSSRPATSGGYTPPQVSLPGLEPPGPGVPEGLQVPGAFQVQGGTDVTALPSSQVYNGGPGTVNPAGRTVYYSAEGDPYTYDVGYRPQGKAGPTVHIPH